MHRKTCFLKSHFQKAIAFWVDPEKFAFWKFFQKTTPESKKMSCEKSFFGIFEKNYHLVGQKTTTECTESACEKSPNVDLNFLINLFDKLDVRYIPIPLYLWYNFILIII